MKMVRLRSSDGEEFEVAEETIGAASVMIKGMLEDDVAVDVIPLPNVTGRILSRILDYVNRHFSDPVGVTSSCPGADDTLRRFDDSFVHVDQDTLFDLLLAVGLRPSCTIVSHGKLASFTRQLGLSPCMLLLSETTDSYVSHVPPYTHIFLPATTTCKTEINMKIHDQD
ncbi:SKP1-like protein 4 isoform X1 [Triticum dicoccoides]|uniref:SKP1-like protein 4 isoform X1 n=1 Tax=Triticum dicoccoides TaxID=85692 RepID=UPI001890088C|nr:SKP1-like protein 4 isoform X1 [Triticum dicoccoides]